MSIVYGGSEGFAAVASGEEWVELWNKNHPKEQLDDAYDSYEYDWQFGVWDDGNAAEFDIVTSHDADAGFDESLGEFGAALSANPDDYNPFGAPVLVCFAPKAPDYFKAVYSDLDEVVADIIATSDTLVPGDEKFVLDHLGYVSIVSYG